jgi:hypothetical protein
MMNEDVNAHVRVFMSALAQSQFNLIGRGSIGVINHEDVDRSCCFLQFQPELMFERAGERLTFRPSAANEGPSASTRLVSRNLTSQLLRRKARHLHIVAPLA